MQKHHEYVFFLIFFFWGNLRSFATPEKFASYATASIVQKSQKIFIENELVCPLEHISSQKHLNSIWRLTPEAHMFLNLKHHVTVSSWSRYRLFPWRGDSRYRLSTLNFPEWIWSIIRNVLYQTRVLHGVWTFISKFPPICVATSVG